MAVARLYFQQRCMRLSAFAVETKSRSATVIESAFSRSMPRNATACATLLMLARDPISAELAKRSTSAEKAASVRRTCCTWAMGVLSLAVSRASFRATGRNGGRFLSAQGWGILVWLGVRIELILMEQSSVRRGSIRVVVVCRDVP